MVRTKQILFWFAYIYFMFLFASELHVELIRFDGSLQYQITVNLSSIKGGCDRMVVGCTTTYAISAYHHWCCEFESRSGRGV
jgi:hypothetical protein